MAVMKEQIQATMELLTTMVVESISKEDGLDAAEVLPDFLNSHTGKMLFDEELKLWCEGPSHIEELYRDEIEKTAQLKVAERCAEYSAKESKK